MRTAPSLHLHMAMMMHHQSSTIHSEPSPYQLECFQSGLKSQQESATKYRVLQTCRLRALEEPRSPLLWHAVNREMQDCATSLLVPLFGQL